MHLQAKVCKIKVSFKVMSVISSSMLLDSSSLSMLLCAESIRTACWHIILGYVSLHMPTTSLTLCALFSCEPLYCSEMLQDNVCLIVYKLPSIVCSVPLVSGQDPVEKIAISQWILLELTHCHIQSSIPHISCHLHHWYLCRPTEKDVCRTNELC